MKSKLNLIIAIVTIVTCKVYGQESISAMLQETLKEGLNFQLLVQADSGNLENVKALLKVDADPNAASWDGTTALMYASQNGHYPVAVELLANYANPNKGNENGFTPLHFAAISNNDSIAELLLLNGAEPHPVTYNGISPIHYASAYGYPFMTYLLTEYGANIDSTDRYGNTPLMLAAYTGSLVTTELLLERWADVDKSDRKGFSPLMVAAQYNDTTIMRLLLDYGADPMLRNYAGNTALSIAMHNKATQAIELLMLEGAAKEEYSTEFSYADIAQKNGYADLSKILQDLGSPLNKKGYVNSFGITSGLTLNGNDFYLLLNADISISKPNVRMGSTFGVRPYYKAVTLQTDYIIYQLFEQRNYFTLYVAKDVGKLRLKKGTHIGVSAGLVGLYSWGKFNVKSDAFTPKSYLKASPLIEVFYNENGFTLSLNGYFNKMEHTQKQPIFVELKCGYTFDLSKPKIALKNVEWL